MAELADAAQTTDRRRLLEVLQVTLAESIEAAAANERAPLARQLVLVSAELERLAAPKEASKVDDLASKRASRRAASKAG